MGSMKKILILAIGILSFAALASCKEKTITFDQLPEVAKTFINTNFPGQNVLLATVDDDLFRPDYEVLLANGVEIKFSNAGALEKISSREGIAAELIPLSIRTYVSSHYPSAVYREFEIGRNNYEVKLSNGLEFKFNSNFNLIEVDD